MLEGAPVKATSEIENHRLHYIDGLRGWAAVFVLFHHASYFTIANVSPIFNVFRTLPLLSDGRFWVYVFFVLSGWSLSIPYLHGKDPDILAKMSLRRYPRLVLPIFISSLIPFALMWFDLLFHVQAAPVVGAQGWLPLHYNFEPDFLHLLQSSFFDTIFRFDDQRSYNLVLWTIAVEFMGSILVFAILALFGRKRARWFAYAAAVLVLGVLESKLLGFIFGMVIAELAHSKKGIGNAYLATLASLALMAGGVYVSWVGGEYHTPVILAVVCSLFVLGVYVSRPLQWLLSTRLSRGLGQLSFPLYLIHFPVVFSLASYLYIELKDWPVDDMALATFGATVGISLLGALLFYPVDRWSIKASHKLGDWLLGRREKPLEAVDTPVRRAG